MQDRAALYLRLSKEDLDKLMGDYSQSIINQRLLLTNYALEHDFVIVDIYIDDDSSGLYDDRPEFERLMRDARLGRFDVVIAKSQSRFTRNMEHLEKYLHHDFPLLGIRFIGVVDGMDTAVLGNKKARQITGLTNEWYCEDLSNNIRAVFQAKMKKGEFIGPYGPYGYIKDPQDKHKLIIDEYAAEQVRRIFALYLSGYGITSICHILEDSGVLPPMLYKQKVQHSSYQNAKARNIGQTPYWSQSTVKRILADEMYLGKLVQGTHKKVSYKDKKVIRTPREEWIVIENHHPAIVDADTFEKVQRMKGKRRVAMYKMAPSLKENAGNPEKTHIFSGKLFCADCGAAIVKSGGVMKKGPDGKNLLPVDDWYLRCRLGNKSRHRECTGHYIRYKQIYDNVLHKIQKLVADIMENQSDRKEISDYVLRMTKDEDRKQEEKLQKELAECQLKLEKNSHALQLLYQDRAEGILSMEEFVQLKNSMGTDNDSTNRRIKELSESLLEMEKRKSKSQDIEVLLKKYCDFSVLTHEMVADFIDYIEIFEKDEFKNQEIRIHWNF